MGTYMHTTKVYNTQKKKEGQFQILTAKEGTIFTRIGRWWYYMPLNNKKTSK